MRRLRRKPWVERVTTLGTRSLCHASELPDLSSAVADVVCARRYLPPLVDLTEPLRRARDRWLAGRPEWEEVDRDYYERELRGY